MRTPTRRYRSAALTIHDGRTSRVARGRGVLQQQLVSAAPAGGQAARHAILCVLGAGLAFSIAAALVKLVASAIPTVEIVLFRSLVASVALLPLLARQGGLKALRTKRPLAHAGRTLFGFIGMLGSFYGYAVLPLATVTALGFAMPLFLTLLSVPLLGEHVGWRRGGAVLVGLCGVLVIVRPWQDNTLSLPLASLLFVIAGVVCWALAMISIRRMGEAGERNVTIVLWFSLGSSLLAAILTAPVWVTPSPWELAGLIAVGLVSALAQMLMTEGYRGGETTLVAPFEYGAILHTTALGALIWGEWPDGWTFTGIGILVASGLYIWRREAMLGLR